MEVIDGQQRLTTLMLLLRAFYTKFGHMQDKASVATKQNIEKCIWKTDEFIELAKLTENSYPPATRCGAYLLMDADEEAQKCFDELPLIAQEEFLKYPICHFGKLTMKEDKPNG